MSIKSAAVSLVALIAGAGGTAQAQSVAAHQTGTMFTPTAMFNCIDQMTIKDSRMRGEADGLQCTMATTPDLSIDFTPADNSDVRWFVSVGPGKVQVIDKHITDDGKQLVWDRFTADTFRRDRGHERVNIDLVDHPELNKKEATKEELSGPTRTMLNRGIAVQKVLEGQFWQLKR